MHHVPVVGTRFANNHKIRVHIGNSETGFVQFMNQCAFAHHIRFLAFLATQEIGGRHRRGIKHAVRYIDTGSGKAVRQILPGLRRIVGRNTSGRPLSIIPCKNSAAPGTATLSCISTPSISQITFLMVMDYPDNSTTISATRSTLIFQQMLEQNTVQHGAFYQRKSADCQR